MNRQEAWSLWWTIHLTRPGLDPVMRTLSNGDQVVVIKEGFRRELVYIWSRRDWVDYQNTTTSVVKERA